MRSDQVTDAADVLEGLLRVAYQQGQRQIGWDDLRAVCEDALVASGLTDGEMDPWTMQAFIEGQSIALAERLARHARPEGRGWPGAAETGGPRFSLLALLRSLHGRRGAGVPEQGAA